MGCCLSSHHRGAMAWQRPVPVPKHVAKAQAPARSQRHRVAPLWFAQCLGVPAKFAKGPSPAHLGLVVVDRPPAPMLRASAGRPAPAACPAMRWLAAPVFAPGRTKACPPLGTASALQVWLRLLPRWCWWFGWWLWPQNGLPARATALGHRHRFAPRHGQVAMGCCWQVLPGLRPWWVVPPEPQALPMVLLALWVRVLPLLAWLVLTCQFAWMCPAPATGYFGFARPPPLAPDSGVPAQRYAPVPLLWAGALAGRRLGPLPPLPVLHAATGCLDGFAPHRARPAQGAKGSPNEQS